MFDRINKKILQGEKAEESDLTPIFHMMKEFGCLGDVLGREFEVYDKNDKLKYKIVQKPMRINQLNIALSELNVLEKLEAEAQKKNGNFNKYRKGRK